ncbi:MAG: ATP-binding protein [Chlorobi bacterium]|nr:ATP-binding protein [Chlorobiota bacterium]
MNIIKKVAIIGSESTGKTELASYLSEKFNTIYIPEIAREYIEKLNRAYQYTDVVNIALKQIEAMPKYITKANNILFFDTDLIITKIWLKHVFSYMPEWMDKKIKEQQIDLYLLCNNDIEWKYDPVRENPQLREYLFYLYKNELENFNFNYKIVAGTGEKRKLNAFKSVKGLF